MKKPEKMENENQYRVIRNSWYERGNIENTYYEVQKRKRFLFWNFWKGISEPSYDGYSTIRFKTLEEAKQFIEKIREGKPASGWREEVVWSDSKIFEEIK
jgi:hypothetical protein